MRRLVTIVKYLFVLVLMVSFLAASGLVPVTESPGQFAWTRWFIQFAKRRSVTVHSMGVKPPPLDSHSLLIKGAGHFETTCRSCHGAPSGPRSRIALGMDPQPPNLSALAPTWSDGELFSIVMHGIAFTGMPAWPEAHRDDEVWAMVAFLRRLPGLGPEEYNRLVGLENMGTYDAARECARCHGPDGRGRGDGAYPRLAGQSATYLRQALQAFSSGARHSGMMKAAVIGVSPDQLDALAVYYAGLEWPPAPDTQAAGVDEGARIAHEGIREQNVPSCSDCHGPGGGERNPSYPRLAGQYEDYLVLQLELFAENRRGGSRYAHIMQQVAPRLKPEQMRAVAKYYASLAPAQ